MAVYSDNVLRFYMKLTTAWDRMFKRESGKFKCVLTSRLLVNFTRKPSSFRQQSKGSRPWRLNCWTDAVNVAGEAELSLRICSTQHLCRPGARDAVIVIFSEFWRTDRNAYWKPIFKYFSCLLALNLAFWERKIMRTCSKRYFSSILLNSFVNF